RAERMLRFVSPKCEWMGPGMKAFVLRGSGYSPKPEARGHQIGLGFSKSALLVSFDGIPEDAMAIRKFDDQDLALEVNHRKYEVGNGTSLWNHLGVRANALKFTMNSDRTLSPYGRHLVLGAKQGTAEIVLVKRALTNDEDAKSRVSTGASRPG
ncbi:unnamed protein product, partial [Durusdinium trenchii]